MYVIKITIMKKSILLIAIIFLFAGCKNNIDTAIENYFNENLKDPSSLVVYSKKVVENYSTSRWVRLDYGAKNSFGGMIRETEYFYIIGDDVMMVASEFEFPAMRDRYNPTPVDTVTVD